MLLKFYRISPRKAHKYLSHLPQRSQVEILSHRVYFSGGQHLSIMQVTCTV